MAAPRDASAISVSISFPFVAAVVVITGVGCRDEGSVRRGDIRSYSIPRISSATVTASRPPMEQPTDSSSSPRLRYDLPDGWVDEGASGLRLATLRIVDGDEQQEVTVIPASGTLETNVARWVGQLDESMDETQRQQAAVAAISAATLIDIDGTQVTVVLLLDPAAAAGDESGEAILGAMIPVDDATALFVKLKGRATVARREQEKFRRFVSSLRWN
ncbi:MAG: hypothetical protein O3A37_07105 [Planctomycetota bacterium]|jgi:hypothetical protein|nr:hypothetical protein [Planctomycetota bacterium]